MVKSIAFYCMEGGGVKKWGRGGGSRECLTAFVPTSDCRFNCHGMIYVPVSEGKLIVTNFQLLAPLVLGGAPILSPAGGAIAPPAPPGHHATDWPQKLRKPGPALHKRTLTLLEGGFVRTPPGYGLARAIYHGARNSSEASTTTS